MTLKEKMKRGPVFGMACFTGTTCVIENIAMSGLDFIYLDLEHTNWMLNEEFEKQMMTKWPFVKSWSGARTEW